MIRAYQAFIARRRRMRPIAEYREPTETEWGEFEQHFALRDVAYGKCERPYGSSCIHEHACVRCPMLRPLPSRLPVLREVESNLVDRIAEAEERVWLGEVKGLQDTLEALREKTARLEQLAVVGVTDIAESMS